MERAILCVVLALAAVPAAPQAARQTAYIRQVDYAVLTSNTDGAARQMEFLFVLYIGSPETELIDGLWARSGIVRNISLVHPVAVRDGRPGSPSGGSSAAASRSRWYVSKTDSLSRVVRRGPLLDSSVWDSVPSLARQALIALGPDDDQLILISWNGISESLSIYYSPQVQTDRPFYEKKLAVLIRYLDAHGWGAEEPFERIDPRAIRSITSPPSPGSRPSACARGLPLPS